MNLHLHPAHADHRSRLHGIAFDPGTALLAFGALAGGSKIMQGIGQYNAGQYNAKVEQENASNVLAAATTRNTQIQSQTTQEIGAAGADIGASGVDTASGSPLTIMSSIAAQGALNQKLNTWQAQTQAVSDNNQAAIDKWQGNQALFGGIISGLGSAGAGAAQSTLLTNPSSTPSPGGFASGGGGPYAGLPATGGGGSVSFMNQAFDF